MNVAVLWDIENVPLKVGTNQVNLLIEYIHNQGRLIRAEAIGDLSNTSIKNQSIALRDAGFDLFHSPNDGQNSSDIILINRGMSFLFNENINSFTLISGDAHF